MKKNITIIGSGFSSLAAACYLAQAGFAVSVYEKNESLGGRARQWKHKGFTFDMGPTWYWMPDVFDRFFADFGRDTAEYYSLHKLDPAYQVYFGKDDSITIGASLQEIADVFELHEPGSKKKLLAFIKSAEENYKIAIEDLVYRPGLSPLELASPKVAKRLHLFLTTVSGQIRNLFKNEKLRRVLEFPVLFLGAKPSNTPAFYNFMNYADFGLGTWYPEKGMYAVVEGMQQLAEELGVAFFTNAPVEKIVVANGSVTGIMVNGYQIDTDLVLSGADYHHSESLLDEKYRAYSPSYWQNRTFAPSSLLFYVGFDKKLKNVAHHTLFFDTDFDAHARAIYDTEEWPEDPLFYASFSSVTDHSTAPQGCEAATFLIPLAPGLEDSPELREKYFNMILNRFEKITGEQVKDHVLFSKSYCVNDFIRDYHSFKGNAYGLANTLTQTAFLRPKLKSKKVKGLFFTGQLTVPGPGVPPSLISGKLSADLIINSYQYTHESII